MTWVLSLIALIGFTVAANSQQTINVFAAASLNGALEAALTGFDAPVRTSYGGSGTMARQVALGAPADLVILAHPAWDTWLADQIESKDVAPALLRNRLVLIAPSGSAPFSEEPTLAQLDTRLGSGRLAMGQSETVPAGQYARDWLTHINAWEDMQLRLAEADNVRTALTYVARGEAPLGIVYSSDADLDDRVEVIWRINPEAHEPINYSARAITLDGLRLLDHLETVEAQARMALYGFSPGEGPN